MSRVALTVQQIDRDTNGLAVTYPAPSSTQLSIPNNDGRMFIRVANTGATTQTVTVQTPGTVAGLDVAEYVATIPPTSGIQYIGAFPPSAFNQSDGSVYVDLSVSTTLTVACMRL